MGNSVDVVKEEMLLHFKEVQMYAEQTIELLNTRKFMIGDPREEQALRERLRDKEFIEMKRRYELKEGLQPLDDLSKKEAEKGFDKWLKVFGITDYE